jgi:coproporphyrinogen III oxidase
MVRDGAEVFLKGYLEMVRKLKDSPCSSDDDVLKNQMRAHWLEYLLMKDGAVRMGREKGHPFDAIRWMGLPPTIHY